MRQSALPWDIPDSWGPALEAARQGGAFLLVGASDSGKSTLAMVLAQEARAAGRAAAVVDADVGQSSIGPPTCVGMARVLGEVRALEELEAEAIDFVGSASPVGHLLQCAVSMQAMAAAARRAGADTLIVDTTGLVAGSAARALKSAKVRLLDPDWIVAVQTDDEVEHLLAPYRRRSRPQVIRLVRSRAVRPRSREERAARRQRKLGAYFAGAKQVEVSWEETPIENSPWTAGEAVPGHIRAYAEERLGCEVLHAERQGDGLVVIAAREADRNGLRALGEGFEGTARAIAVGALEHLLVGLLGENGETLGLGILEGVDFPRHRLTILTPVGEPGRARGLRLGAIRLARDGTELGWNEPGAVG